MRIIFMGTPDFAKESLAEIYNAGYEIIGVVTNQDKPQGRGMKMIASPVKEFATEHNLKIYQPIKIKNNEEFFDEISSLKPDLFCVVAYGKILPKNVLEIPKYGTINVHGSLLPKYRGAAPIQMAVINGEKETGITTMFMDEGMDTGDMILSEKVKIGEDETTGELWQRLSKIGAKLLVKTVKKIEEVANSQEIKKLEEKFNNNVIPEQIEKYKLNANKEKWQNENKELNINNEEHLKTASKVASKEKSIIKEEIKKIIGAKKQGNDFTVAPMITKKMAEINWNKTSEEIHNLVRGLAPQIGAYTFYKGKKLKIWKTKIISKENLSELQAKEKSEKQSKAESNIENNIKNDVKDNIENGNIVFADKKNGIIVKTSNGAIQILEIQAENSKKMNVKDFLNGNKIENNESFKSLGA